MLTNRVSITAFVLTQFLSLSFSSDITVLLSFKALSDRSNSLSSWVNSSNPCSDHWLGVTCDPESGRVTRLVLENLNLTGSSTRPLSQLSELRLLSLKQNLLTSSSTLDLSSWPNLKLLYLCHNRFSGEFPAGISTLRRLRRIDLSHNEFSGKIPLNELAKLPHLLTLRLESNSFDSELNTAVDPYSCTISDFNVSNNNLSGEIPSWLSRFPASSFAGNNLLCGDPLSHSCPNNNSTDHNQSQSSDEKDKVVLVTILTIVSVAVLALAALLTVRWCKKKKVTWRSRESSSSSSDGGGGGPMVVAFEGCSKDIKGVEDLLGASAEMMGKGSVGTTYKVAVNGGGTAAVKKVRKGGSGFGKEVDWWLREVLGKLRHTNVVSLRAYHRSHDEELLLLVYDFLPNGILHSLLHGNRGPGRTPLDWPTRLRIASDSARGLAFLHNTTTTTNNNNKAIKLFHGHFTSSNIILDHSGNACISDTSLHQLLRLPPPHNAYTAPELTATTSPGKYTQKCDVYSFGVVLMEILTGKMVEEEEEEGEDFVIFIQNITNMDVMEVLDYELLVYKDVMEEEIMALMEVAMLCLAPLQKDRPEMSLVYRMIEDIRKKGVGDEQETTSIMDELVTL
ncbi:probable leucine-rich repeat receptor-like protein kinase At1g68400 [Humulus lupulus]|uniref:probable leucine-rich repeat receptor-like protein kinase At1g68400 n=1 Tax=Humulus lupulus TaxID=3486 RepID=UPI002B40ECB7|nr:probable leucine-rich repeat receptor-like protein kinase At1g68400 [Humulus lupulus]